MTTDAFIYTSKEPINFPDSVATIQLNITCFFSLRSQGFDGHQDLSPSCSRVAMYGTR